MNELSCTKKNKNKIRKKVKQQQQWMQVNDKYECNEMCFFLWKFNLHFSWEYLFKHEQYWKLMQSFVWTSETFI